MGTVFSGCLADTYYVVVRPMGAFLMLALIFCLGTRIPALVLPRRAAVRFGIPVLDERALAYVRTLGARDLAFVFAAVMFYLSGTWKGLAIIGLAAAMATLLDALIIMRVEEPRNSVKHWVMVAVLTVLSLQLLT